MSRLILSIETSSKICSVGLLSNGKNLGFIEELDGRKHAELLPEFVEKLLKKNKVQVKSIDAIAVSIGPGSFTGLRVGLSFAKGVAYAIKCPIIPVPTILSIAYSLRKKKPTSGIIRSHGEKVFFQDFRWDFEKPIIKSRPIFGELNEFKNKLENSFHYDCKDIIKEGSIPEAYPSSISVAKLSTIYFKEWLKENPYDLTSDYIYPYKTN